MVDLTVGHDVIEKFTTVSLSKICPGDHLQDHFIPRCAAVIYTEKAVKRSLHLRDFWSWPIVWKVERPKRSQWPWFRLVSQVLDGLDRWIG